MACLTGVQGKERKEKHTHIRKACMLTHTQHTPEAVSVLIGDQGCFQEQAYGVTRGDKKT